MHYLVAYDIADPKRLRLVARTCEDYGLRVQKSVFECDLEQEYFEQLWAELEAVIDHGLDFVGAWPLCGTCRSRARTLGRMSPADDSESAIIC